MAHGAYISFHARLSGGTAKLYWRPTYFNHSVLGDSAKERLTDQFLNCKHTLYAVHRTDDLRYIFGEVKKTLDSEVKILLFGELLSTMLAAVRGKIKNLDVFYSARREDTPYQGQHIKWPLVRDYVENGQFWPESVNFKECLTKNLLAKDSVGLEEARALINDGLNTFIKRSLPPDYFRHMVLHTANFLKNKNVPDWIYELLKKIYRSFVPVKRGGTASDFSGTNLHDYNHDFKILREIILKHAQS